MSLTMETLIDRMRAAAGTLASALPTSTPMTPGNPTHDSSSVPMEAAAVTVVSTMEGGLPGTLMIMLAQGPSGEVGTTAELAQALAPGLAEFGQSLGVTMGPPTLASGTPTVDAHVAVPLMMNGIAVGGVLLYLEQAPEPVEAASAADPAPAADAAMQAARESTVGNAGRVLNVSRIDVLSNVEMEITIEVGRTRLPIGELLALTPGQVLELDRAAGAPSDMYVNGTLLAHGEIVVVDEMFGFRVTEIVADATK